MPGEHRATEISLAIHQLATIDKLFSEGSKNPDESDDDHEVSSSSRKPRQVGGLPRETREKPLPERS